MNDPLNQPSTLDFLKNLFTLSQQVCDPIEYQNRQKYLLLYLAKYILEKDLPKEDKEVEKQL